MSTYLQSEGVRARFARTVDAHYKESGTVNETWITDDIAAVEGYMNQRLGIRYALPITDTTALAYLQSLAEDLFHERMYVRKPSGTLPQAVKDAADRARKDLNDIAAGAPLVGSSGLSQTRNIKVTGNTPAFTADDLEGF